MHRARIGLCFFFLFQCALSAFADESSTPLDSSVPAEGRLTKAANIFAGSLFDIPKDVKDITLYPFDNRKTTGLFLLGISGLVAVDKPVTTYYQDHVEKAFQGYRLATPAVMRNSGFYGSDAYLLLGLAGTYLGGVSFNDEHSQHAALLATKAMGYSFVYSQLILKSLTGRKRPVPDLSKAAGDSGPYTTDPYSFGHFHAPAFTDAQFGTSMPSFHVTMYFAVARVFQQEYDNYAVPYSLAAVAFAANIRSHHHWVSDMVAGSLIGTMIGSQVSENGKAHHVEDDGYILLPIVTSDTVALTLYRSF